VPNATVVFTSPETGASGEFANDSRTFSVTTVRTALLPQGYHPNAITGSYGIRVRATWQNETSTATFHKEMCSRAGRLRKENRHHRIAAAAVGAVIASRSHSSTSSTSSNAPTITLGRRSRGAAVIDPRNNEAFFEVQGSNASIKIHV